MSQTDPIADFITCIRNAQAVKKPWVDIPASNLKKRICFVLKEEHFPPLGRSLKRLRRGY